MNGTAVIFGGPSPEHDISVSTGLQVTHTLGDVTAIYWDKTGRVWSVDPSSEPVDFAEGVPRKARELGFSAVPGEGFVARRKPLDIDVVVVCCHGGPGEDGTLQGALDLAGYAYTGPDVGAASLTMDKLAFGGTMAAAGLPTLPRVALAQGMEAPSFDPPYIVKPRFGGSSIGVEVVSDLGTALDLFSTSPHLADGAVLEPFLSDFRDLQLAVRTHPHFQTSPIEEPILPDGGLYSYRQKYLAWGDGPQQGVRHLPADVDAGRAEALREAARTITRLVGLRSIARIDFLEAGEEWWVNEVNAIPGSLSSYLWIDPPLDRAALLGDMIAEAREHGPRRFGTAGADGIALRNADSIASKLG
jgi:D-alanine-D-alanine ligase